MASHTDVQVLQPPSSFIPTNTNLPSQSYIEAPCDKESTENSSLRLIYELGSPTKHFWYTYDWYITARCVLSRMPLFLQEESSSLPELKEPREHRFMGCSLGDSITLWECSLYNPSTSTSVDSPHVCIDALFCARKNKLEKFCVGIQKNVFMRSNYCSKNREEWMQQTLQSFEAQIWWTNNLLFLIAIKCCHRWCTKLKFRLFLTP